MRSSYRARGSRLTAYGSGGGWQLAAFEPGWLACRLCGARRDPCKGLPGARTPGLVQDERIVTGIGVGAGAYYGAAHVRLELQAAGCKNGCDGARRRRWQACTNIFWAVVLRYCCTVQQDGRMRCLESDALRSRSL